MVMRWSWVAGRLLGLLLAASAATLVSEALANGSGRWLCGDFHSHTVLTDGNYTIYEVARQGLERYGLDWMANSEHGGRSRRDLQGNPLPGPVWRWLSLSLYSYPAVQELRREYPHKLIVQGLEWNVPAHEHASVGIVANEPVAISTFEYQFDAADNDTSRAQEGLEKRHRTHQDALAALTWLKDRYPDTSYVILNHPSRQLKYSVADLRDFHNAAPEVVVGFEGLPGHQKARDRGNYGRKPLPPRVDSDLETRSRTHGGADYMVAKVGGLWDALLGEGRCFWVFASSDFHQTRSGFWPGEYAKTCIMARGGDYRALVEGLRSGNSFAALGDLIQGLEFRAVSGSRQATMGQTLIVRKGRPLSLTIRYRSPAFNHHGEPVRVDHIDLIAGAIRNRAVPGTREYRQDTNDSTMVLKRFATRRQKPGKDRWVSLSFRLASVRQPLYFRLRGTNLAPSTLNETDAQGNPLADALMGVNDAAKARRDLWFYSNPIFVQLETSRR